jgi:hypothetical protein
MSQYHTINAGELERGFTVIARLDGSPITAGTVNYYLKCKSGANAGKWWRDSDQSWQATETANAMTHDADGHWDVLLTAGGSGPFVAGVRCREYVKEDGNLHVPKGRLLVCDAAPGSPGGPLVVGAGAGGINPSGGKVAATIAPGDNADKTGYSLVGASGGVGPTAGIADEDIYTTAFKNGTARLCAHVYKDGADIHQADVATIAYSVFLLDDQDPDARAGIDGHTEASLDAADVIFDTLQSDSQASDYNFRHVIPIADYPAFTIAGRNYLVENTIAPVAGEKIILRFRVHVL